MKNSLRRPRLPAEFVEHRRYLEHHVRQSLEGRRGALQVVSVVAEVRRDVARLRVGREHAIALGEQVVERRLSRRVVAAAREEREFEPALVPVVHLREELHRLRGVDQHRDVESCARLPHGVHHRVVELQAAAVGLLRRQAEVLVDLQPDRAVPDRALEVGDGLVGPAGRVGAVPVDVGEDPESVRVPARLDEVGLLLDCLGTGAATQVHEHPHVHRVQFSHQALDGVGRGPGVAVDVHDRELGLRHQVLLGDQRRPRPVVDDARRRELRLLAAAGAYFGRARRALAAGIGRH